MTKDIIDLLDQFLPDEDRRKWAKLQSTIDSRRLELLLLKEILLELRKLNQNLERAMVVTKSDDSA